MTNTSSRKRVIELPDRLRDSIREKRCVVYIGSGLSSKCYDMWHELINRLCSQCGLKQKKYTETSSDEELLEAAQMVKDKDTKQYYAILAEHFGQYASMTTTYYQTIVSCPFRSYMTVNFDPLLALAARTAVPPCVFPPRVYPELDRADMTKRTINYLHGMISDDSPPGDGRIVLSQLEFDEAYEANSHLMNLLVPTIEKDDICFIGCRLRGKAMSTVFDICRRHQELVKKAGRSGYEEPRRYILLGVDESKTDADGMITLAKLQEENEKQIEEENDYYKRLGIEVWRYPAMDNHRALWQALEPLANYPKNMPSYPGSEGGLYGN